MPKIELELDDNGEILGKLPSQIEALFKRTETAGYGNGLKKGREDATAETTAQAEARIKAEREKWEAENPTARVKELEEENLRFRESETTLVKRYGDTARQREEAHAKEMADRGEAISKRDAQLEKALKSTIRAAAITAGARDESLQELEDLLVSKVKRDADLEPYVKGSDDRPLTVQGKPVTVEAFVKQYVDQHAHHRKPAGGQGGGARGGASYQGQGGVPTEEAARARIEAGDKSPGAINALFEATRKQKAS